MHMKMIDGAASSFSEDPFAMRIIDHDHRTIFLGKLHKRRQRRDIAIHRKHAIGDDQRASSGAGGEVFFQFLIERYWIAMLKPNNGGAG